MNFCAAFLATLSFIATANDNSGGLDEQARQAAAVGLLTGHQPTTVRDGLGRTSLRIDWHGDNATFKDELGRTVGKATKSGNSIRFSDGLGRSDGQMLTKIR